MDISVAARDGDARIEVADDGPGLPEGEEERIFERFYRSPGSPGAEGSGLGLSIVGAIAAAHGGRVTATNRPGGGSIFSVDLPLVRVDSPTT